MKVALTGASGFLGSHVADALVAAGHEVVAVVRDPVKAAFLAERGIALARADLREPEALAAAFSGADAVVSNAALAVRSRPPPEEYVAANVVGTANVVGAAASAGIRRVVHVSSAAVYQTRLRTRLTEDAALVDASAGFSWSRLTTNWHYSLTKADGERRAWAIARERGLLLTVLRPGPIYGSRDPKMTTTYRKLLDWPVLLAPTVRMPHVHAGDVARAIVGALANEASAGKAYNVTGESVSPWEVLRTLRSLVGGRTWILPVPVPLWVGFDDSAAARDLGFRSRSLEEGLAEAVGAKRAAAGAA